MAQLTLCPIRHIIGCMNGEDKPLVWLEGEIKTHRLPQRLASKPGRSYDVSNRGRTLECRIHGPCRPWGPGCHELRIRDADQNWRVIYRIDADAVVIVDVFAKRTGQTPQNVINRCQRRLRVYDENA
jgi:phage-related protein